MHLVRWSAGLATAAVMSLTLAVPAIPAGAATARAEVDFHAALHGSTAFPNARGHSEYDRSSTKREVEVTVNNLPGRLRGHRVTVYVNRQKVGTMLVNSSGSASREWSTERGQFVPFAGSGSPCRVRTASNTLIVSGTYVREPGD
jgi:hypothetical protein